jgi:hypothetical protein
METQRDEMNIPSPWEMRDMLLLRHSISQSSRFKILYFFQLYSVNRCSACLSSVEQLLLQERYSESL